MHSAIYGKWSRARNLLLLVVSFCAVNTRGSESEDRWWPVQIPPKALLQTPDPPSPSLAFLLQSVSGLAAKAVNEDRGNEMVWVEHANPDLEDWYARWLASYPNNPKPRTLGTWELVDHFAQQGLIKGYILYRQDKSAGELNAYRPGMDSSVNVATSLAGLLDGIIVAEDLEPEAKAHNLKRLLDARDKSQSWCFKTYRDRFNRHLLCTQDPKKPNVRDFAIAQRAFTVFGGSEPTPAVMAWLEPLSPILGWNGGDEFETTDLSSRFAHIQTATDWCNNLPVLMAGSDRLAPARVKSFDPATIDWRDQRSGICFIDSDGDNVQWLQGSFFCGNPSYWSNPERGKIPFGWSCCFAHLTQLCPQAIAYAAATRTTNDWFVEFGGGYYYPDRFAMDRPNRWELVARHARRTWALMSKANTRIIGFNFSRYDSSDARRACEVFAKQTDGLLAILAFQYYPYEGGAGKIYWVKDRNQIEVPVISARYSIWENSNQRERAGTPAKIAREIRATDENASSARQPRYDWVICHAWSWFKKAPGTDENAENLPQENADASGAVRGYSPALWCAQRLAPNIRVISPEEMAWRVRMQHNPAQTRRFMQQFR